MSEGMEKYLDVTKEHEESNSTHHYRRAWNSSKESCKKIRIFGKSKKFPNSAETPLPQTGCDTRSVFKLSIADLNSEFSFS